MSLESKIDALIKAVEANTAAIMGTQVKAAPVSTPVVTQAETAALVAPVAVAAVQMHPVATPVVTPVVTPAAVQMPATPTFAQPAAAAATGLPFNDAASVMAYTVSKYGTLGKDKGAKIQDVLTGLGCNTLTDLTPEKYPHYYAGVEAIQ